MSFQHVPYAMKIPPMEATFENFPDEILLSICRYLSQYEIFWAFHDLNHRLNCTISGYFHSMIVRENIGPDYRDRPHLLPLIGSCLRSLKIRGTHITAANIRAAPNIQELTLHYARADIIPTLEYLTDVNIIDCPKLQVLDFLFANPGTLHSLYISSSTPLTVPTLDPPRFSAIRQIAVNLRTVDDLRNLLILCPQLTCLNLFLQSTGDSSPADDPSSRQISSSLRQFSLRMPSDLRITFDHLNRIFAYITADLEQLALIIDIDEETYTRGTSWEKYLTEIFPALPRFEFYMTYHWTPVKGIRSLKLSTILSTFLSPFWSRVMPQELTGYYDRPFSDDIICFHSRLIPQASRRRFFLN